MDKADREVSDDVLENLRQMTGLRSLSIDSYEEGRFNGKIMDYVSTTAVETLDLQRGWANLMLRQYLTTGFVGRFQLLKTLVIADGNQTLAEHKRPATQPHTSRIEEISVDSDCHPENLRQLLMWPKALRKVEIGTLYNHYVCATLHNVTTIQQLLDSQSSSLRHIRIPAYDCRDDSLPDFSHYTSLTHLKLNKRNIFTCQPIVAAKKLSCPHLETIDINMDDEGEWGGIIRSQEFQENHANWILGFATNYRGLLPEGSLRTIHIGFHWYGNYMWYRPEFEKPWPNACLGTTRSAVAELGFDLTWPEPAITEAEWAEQSQKRHGIGGTR